MLRGRWLVVSGVLSVLAVVGSVLSAPERVAADSSGGGPRLRRC